MKTRLHRARAQLRAALERHATAGFWAGDRRVIWSGFVLPGRLMRENGV